MTKFYCPGDISRILGFFFHWFGIFLYHKVNSQIYVVLFLNLNTFLAHQTNLSPASIMVLSDFSFIKVLLFNPEHSSPG